MIRARELQRAASTVSHTQLCNFFCHFTLISSCVPLCAPVCPCMWRTLNPHPLYTIAHHLSPICLCAQLHRASRHRILLRHIAHPPLSFSVMPNSSPSFCSRRLLTGFARRLPQFRVRCIMLHQAPGCSWCQHSFRLYTTSCLFPFIFISSQLKLHGRIPAHWFR